ncbi:GNAT family N-acetyltransferase [Streptomyces caniscabiei]|uniref:GNAT family N-acetyltransferase n=1 Tax=Streptomyces caniscabiei TaxID=2746961 RepID=A0A927L4M6_9ACTN|nr:GNAT family N-acetyltransferase [Streptomyces caniscabiei]MBD9701143.1 GNAT family N-acetyltransferase [Streptomyces caniscabiei]MBD9725986.1 GNAT family N-acetyltransferase [Streptomyces caniscabiei]MDX3507709.1 GNAT family N-acetyltransferase [Streptomyces caniscabiei]MDX3717671.1 GNAT family N-acetyltransferase [Streptomyces caniscabiei]MDX3726680.1 GNAT family N-acetyltransferase [Streptomyces caniscabiei]
MTGFWNVDAPEGQPVRLTYASTAAPGGTAEFILHGPCGRVIGRLRFRACRACRTGRILDLWVCEMWQRQGLGRGLVCSLFAHRRGYRWTTTLQSRPGRAFFAAMTRETALSLPHGGPLCPHLMGWFRRTWRRLLHAY